MILSDRDIRAEIEAGRIVVDLYLPDAVQPSSVDLHLGNRFGVFRNNRTAVIDPRADQPELTELVEIAGDEPFILHPGEFVLGATFERVALPDDLVARLEGKSRWGGWVCSSTRPPGTSIPDGEGTLTLELSNVANLPIKLYDGMKIGQISFQRLSSPVEIGYGDKRIGSKYRGQTDLTASRYHADFEAPRGDRAAAAEAPPTTSSPASVRGWGNRSGPARRLFRPDAGGFFGVVPRPLWSRFIGTDERGRIPAASTCCSSTPAEADPGRDRHRRPDGAEGPRHQGRRGGDPVAAMRAVGEDPATIDFVVVTTSTTTTPPAWSTRPGVPRSRMPDTSSSATTPKRLTATSSACRGSWRSSSSTSFAPPASLRRCKARSSLFGACASCARGPRAPAGR